MVTRPEAVAPARGVRSAADGVLAQQVQRWHRRIGLLAGALLALLALSGIALNHTDALELAARPVTASWVLAHYGRAAQAPERGFVAGDHTVAVAADTVFVDGRPLPAEGGRLVGAVALPSGLLLVALERALLVVDPPTTLVERIGDADGLPAPVTAIGTGSGGVPVLAGTDGAHAVDLERLHWRRHHGAVRWAQPVPLDTAAREALRRGAGGAAVSLERVLLDLHSGRWFGPVGVLVVDLVGLACLLLAASGVWTWWRTGRQGRGR